MSLRDYFAAKAMHAEIVTTCSDMTPDAAAALAAAALRSHMTPIDRIAVNAYRMADAMLKARETPAAARTLTRRARAPALRARGGGLAGQLRRRR